MLAGVKKNLHPLGSATGALEFLTTVNDAEDAPPLLVDHVRLRVLTGIHEFCEDTDDVGGELGFRSKIGDQILGR